ncbi:hypothetical protein [Labilibacter marinus]|uniref:hypothetical protein n=1 Tax=Labilibacter marinus TaxID=1477105 RepID=UPI0008369093|nr:hypothetical protein [Labilibacter marinus]
MKHLLLIIAVACVTNLVYAQEESNEIRTIFSNESVRSNGGYGGLMVNYSNIANRDAILMGAKGGWVINHAFTLGLGGYGFITEPKHDVSLNKDYEFAGGYGGLLLEPIIGAKHPVHLSFPILIGAGGVAYTTTNFDYDNNYNYEDTYEDSDAFFVLEPGVELEFNVVKFMRFALSCSYRYTSDVNLSYTSEGTDFSSIASKNMLHGWNFGLAFKFGKF